MPPDSSEARCTSPSGYGQGPSGTSPSRVRLRMSLGQGVAATSAFAGLVENHETLVGRWSGLLELDLGATAGAARHALACMR